MLIKDLVVDTDWS